MAVHLGRREHVALGSDLQDLRRRRHPKSSPTTSIGSPVTSAGSLQDGRHHRSEAGIEKTVMIRARGDIGFTLTEAMDDGHSGFPLMNSCPWRSGSGNPGVAHRGGVEFRTGSQRGRGGRGRRPPAHLPGPLPSGRTSDRRPAPSAARGRVALAAHRSRRRPSHGSRPEQASRSPRASAQRSGSLCSRKPRSSPVALASARLR